MLYTCTLDSMKLHFVNRPIFVVDVNLKSRLISERLLLFLLFFGSKLH